MDARELLALYEHDSRIDMLQNRMELLETPRFHLQGLSGSSCAVFLAALYQKTDFIHFVVLDDKEQAAYFFNDLENILGEKNLDYNKRKVLFFPTSYKKAYEIDKTDNANVLLRTEVFNRILKRPLRAVVVSYPEALSEKIVDKKYLQYHTLKLKKDDVYSLDELADKLIAYEFERVDFVVEPGQFAIRGGLVDVFGYANNLPFRVEFTGDAVSSLRSFDPESQLSADRLSYVHILPDVQKRSIREKRIAVFDLFPKKTALWFSDLVLVSERIRNEFEKAVKVFENLSKDINHQKPEELFITERVLYDTVAEKVFFETGNTTFYRDSEKFVFDIIPQPPFNKKFELLLERFKEHKREGIKNIISADNPRQLERIDAILKDIQAKPAEAEQEFIPLYISLHEGFIDRDQNYALFTDHQIFDRYHKFYLRDRFKSKEAITLKEFYGLKPGDYVTHIDHGIGIFDGLEKIDVNGKQQEAIRLIYKNKDLLYVSIHSLHRISKYVGKEGTPPALHRLGSQSWKTLKAKTKSKVKDIAKDLIKLYAERKTKKGFSFSPDMYLQHELEASFIYEDTPDQVKSTRDVKKDMEAGHPMDRLICGDVGFGKTEVAIRAAFKSVADSKQVALLVPTTILAMQHYNTFRARLQEFPCKVDYISRFRTQKQQKQILKEVAEGKIDVLIGTHRMIGKDVKFKDLGLLIIDEEQKFGVAAKEKLRNLRVNVDTLTLTATPIPRTLQFSLMGARDLSVINTPPPNRYPIQTELHTFNEEVIRDAIAYEVSRGGQVYFVNNRIQNIMEVAGMIQRLIPDANIAIGHGQMEGQKLEKIMLEFIDGYYDVLVATTIIESGLDIPNVNTIIINDAHNFGLSVLHQLRGRVGRTNKKAFCYLLAPPLSVISNESRKRLKAIEDFSELGSGFNIAMRDLDIRGAGNILGAEQSGFIADIGFEMYQKILDEAIMELKESEFKDLYKQEGPQAFVSDCQIETDLEIMIPDDYVPQIAERLSLYRELDDISTEEDLESFRRKMLDRFGPLPITILELLNTIRFRWYARKAGFEKVLLNGGKFIGYFISNQESPYYQSGQFSHILHYVKDNPDRCRMRESKNKLSLIFKDVRNIKEAIRLIRPMLLEPNTS